MHRVHNCEVEPPLLDMSHHFNVVKQPSAVLFDVALNIQFQCSK